MSNFTAIILKRDDYDKHMLTPGLTFTPLEWSGSWRGGPKDALIHVDGAADDLVSLLDMLTAGVRIRNEDGASVWLGMIWGITLHLGGRRYHIDVENCHNKISIDYTALNERGGIESYSSDWVEDEYSQGLYGVREIRISMEDEANPAIADQRATIELANRKLPMPKRSEGDGTYSAQLECVGLIKEIDEQYHTNEFGRLEYQPSGVIHHPVGWYTEDIQGALSDNGEGDQGSYSTFDDSKLPPGPLNSRFVLAGTSGGNNGTYTIVSRPADDVETLSTTSDGAGFRWDGSGGSNYLVEPMTEGLGFLNKGQAFDINITTSSQKDDGNYVGFAAGEWGEPYKPDWPFEGYFFVRETGSERVKCDWDAARSSTEMANDQGGVSDHPNQSVGYLHGTLTAAANVIVSPAPVSDEQQDNADTFAAYSWGWSIAMPITIDAATAGPLWKIAVHVAKVGTPTDYLKVGLYEDDGAGRPTNTPIDYGLLSEADVGTDVVERWVVMENANDNTLVAGETYWLRVYRSDVSGNATAISNTNHTANYWVLGIYEDSGVDGGDDLMYDSEAQFWDADAYAHIDRPTGACIPFRIWTGVDVSVQIKAVIDAHSNRIASCFVADESGELVSPYYEGERRAGDIVQNLLKIGASDGQNLMLDLLPDKRHAMVKKQPLAGSWESIRIGLDGRIENVVGGQVSRGQLFYGQWATDAGAPLQSSSIASMNPVFIASMRYNAVSDKYTIETPTERDLFDMGYRDG